ncbi:MAG: MFS transporter, partial [Halieaceae bacterium]|nr:MFS transporter [Halieaceae bacterium]
MLSNMLRKAVQIEPGETRATLTSFGFVFVLMAAYYILRPVRDAMASDWTDAEVSWLWTLNFFISAAVVSLYGAAVSGIRFRRLVPSVYGFFAFSFVAFYLGTQVVTDRDLVDKAFYVWISVFSLFHISVFWSFMAELFSRQQSLRLFGFIGAGASTGALLGPTLPALFVQRIGTDNLILVAAGLLLLTLPVIALLQRLQAGNTGAGTQAVSPEYALGGNPLAGFLDFVRSPYMLAIGLFILLYTSLSSFIYFELKNLMADFSRTQRTQIWASMDLAVNTLTLLTAAFVTGRIASRFGLGVTLCSVPFLICGGMFAVAAAPSLALVVGLQILRRAGNYAITRPGREMLFTAVDRETRFKTKPVIDIVVYRGGDTLNAWAFTALTQGLGLGLGAVALVGAGIAAIWGLTGLYLGGMFKRQPTAA